MFYSMSDDDIVSFTGYLCDPLKKAYGPARHGELISKTWRTMKAYRSPPTSRDFRRITPDDLRTLYNALCDLRYHDFMRAAPSTVRMLYRANPQELRQPVYDVYDVFADRTRGYMKLHLALEHADRIGGSVREMAGRPLPQLTEDQLLRHRWRRAMGTVPDIYSDVAGEIAHCCPYSLVRVGIEDDSWGITPSAHEVAHLEIVTGVNELGEAA